MLHNISRIRQQLENKGNSLAGELLYFEEIDSTNDYLMGSSEPASETVALTDFQTKGRGRRGRTWNAAPGSSVMFSMVRVFQRPSLSGLSLAVGVSVANALSEFGVKDISLKWPNDILLKELKLGGILIEISGSRTVIGMGLNVDLNLRDETPDSGLLRTDLVSHLYDLDRDELASALIDNLIMTCREFDRHGFGAFMSRWSELDHFMGENVRLESVGETIRGTVHGVDESGAILIESNGCITPHIGGEISLRAENQVHSQSN